MEEGPDIEYTWCQLQGVSPGSGAMMAEVVASMVEVMERAQRSSLANLPMADIMNRWFCSLTDLPQT